MSGFSGRKWWTSRAYKCTSAGKNAWRRFKMCNYKRGLWLSLGHSSLFSLRLNCWLMINALWLYSSSSLLTIRGVQSSAPVVCSDCTGGEPFRVQLMKNPKPLSVTLSTKYSNLCGISVWQALTCKVAPPDQVVDVGCRHTSGIIVKKKHTVGTIIKNLITLDYFDYFKYGCLS